MINGSESSLISKAKEKQEKDPIFLELRVNVHKEKVLAFELGAYGN